MKSVHSELKKVGSQGAGQTILVPDGLYEESLTSFPSGSEGAPFILKAENPGGATIKPNSGERILAIYASHVIIDGFVLDGVYVQGNNIWIEGGTNVVIQNCELKNTQSGDGTGEGSFQGIFAYATSYNTIRNCEIHDIAPNGSRYNHGIYWIGANSIIENNIIYGVGGNAVQIYGSSTPPIANNIVRGNTMYDYALRGVANGVYTEGTNDSIYNNVIYQTTSNGNAVGISLAGANQTAYHNTVYQNGYIGIGVSGSGCKIQNNIVYQNGTNIENTSGDSTVSKNLTADPKFMGANDFRLQPGSPAIDAGVDVGITTDILGATRSGSPDQGAYEFVSGNNGGGGGGGGESIAVQVTLEDGTVYQGQINPV